MAKKVSESVVKAAAATLAASEDQQLVEAAGIAIRNFLLAVPAFFTTAQSLERRAKESQAAAKLLSVPSTVSEDEDIQRFIKATTADRKEVESHWGITATISGFHRRMTAARSRATDALEEANNTANKLHNTYVETEKRRAAAEQERIRREAEDLARRQREEELARMEAEAVKREEASPNLSERERVFVENFHLRGDGIRAAQAAGFKDAAKTAARLLTLPKVMEAIRLKREAVAIREQATARKAEPVEVEVPTIRPNLAKAPGGGSGRTTWSGELLDFDALMEAFLSGKHGIPRDVFMVNPVKLNEYARSLQSRLDLWPGVRAKKSTKVV